MVSVTRLLIFFVSFVPIGRNVLNSGFRPSVIQVCLSSGCNSCHSIPAMLTFSERNANFSVLRQYSGTRKYLMLCIAFCEFRIAIVIPTPTWIPKTLYDTQRFRYPLLPGYRKRCVSYLRALDFCVHCHVGQDDKGA